MSLETTATSIPTFPMLFLTHLLGGILAITYLGSFFGLSGWVPVVVAALFSILPDIDSVKSFVGKRAGPFSTAFSFLFKHRGFLHSFIFTAIVYFLVRYLFSATVATAAVIGYSSHLLLDAITKEGIMPFSPFSRLRIKGFIKTKGIFEVAVFILLLLLIVAKSF